MMKKKPHYFSFLPGRKTGSFILVALARVSVNRNEIRVMVMACQVGDCFKLLHQEIDSNKSYFRYNQNIY